MGTPDYLVVGGGSAGCALAARLAEDPTVNVVLIEAGGDRQSSAMRMPAAFYALLKTPELLWGYQSEPEPHANNRTLPLQRGRLLGGTGAINGMTYARGDRHDYDGWAAAGATGWDYDGVLPYFKRAEGNWRGETTWHGGNGPLRVSRVKGKGDPFRDAIRRAAIAQGERWNEDYCGEHLEGFADVEFTIGNGRRASTAQAYLRPAMARANLDVVCDATVRRVIFDGKRAVGVEFERAGNVQTMYANREIILTAGAYNSAQLLILSGVGPVDELTRHGIPMVSESPGVGSNLQDHVVVAMTFEGRGDVTWHRQLRADRAALGALQWQLFGTGPFSELPLSGWGFIKSAPTLTRPDVQFFFSPVSMDAHVWFPGTRKPASNLVTARHALMRPGSRGRLRLRSADPSAPPSVVSNLLDNDADVMALVRAMRRTRTLMASAQLAPLVKSEQLPGVSSQDDASLIDYLRGNARTACHPCGTCAMGDGPLSVVDAELRVRGVSGLRVADASVMPNVVSGNLNAPTIMIAERAADLLLGRTTLRSDTATSIDAQGTTPADEALRRTPATA